jgi:hypothetical protein
MQQKRHSYKCVVAAEALLKACKEVGVEANAKKTKYMSVPPEWNAGQYHNTETNNKSSHNTVKLKYLGTLTNEKRTHEGLKSKLNSGNACYISVKKFLFYLLLTNLRHCATNRNGAGSIPDGVIGIFH